MKRILWLLVIAMLFFTCSKDKTQQPANPPVSEMIGTWSTYSFKAKYPSDSLVAAVSDHPCLANNKIEYKSDHTLTTHYAGNDSCWLTPPPTPPVIIRTGTVFGEASDVPNTSTWTQSGTTIFIGPGRLRGTISKAGGRTYLTQVDTIDNASIHEIVTIVQVKD